MKISTPTELASTTASEVRDIARVRPRVAYLLSLFPCWSETFIADEIQQLLNHGFDITIISLRPACEPHVHKLAQTLLSRALYAESYPAILTAQIYFLWKRPSVYISYFWQVLRASGGKPSKILKLLATFVLAVYFSRVLEENKIERIHAHWATYPATAAWIVKALTGIPYSFTVHAHDLFLADGLLKKKGEQASFVVTISNYNRQRISDCGIDIAKIRVIHCGVDTTKFTPTEDTPRKPNSIVCVGRLVPIKGFETLIDACRILIEQKVELSCEIVGDGPLLQPLQQQISQSGIGHAVHLRGFMSQEQVRAKLSDSELFVLPSRQTQDGDQDGIPVALMEAMAMGVPVISTSVSGIPELVQHGVNGILVPPDDPQRLAEAIADLLLHREKRTQLAQHARQTVLDDFDVAKNSNRLAQMLMEQA